MPVFLYSLKNKGNELVQKDLFNHTMTGKLTYVIHDP